MKRVLAISAHPDDIEFMMSGTMRLLKDRGFDLHYMTVGNGSCGTVELDAAEICEIRRRESVRAAEFIGAVYHDSLVNDIEIFYQEKLLRQVTAVVREVAPRIVLTHARDDYMEDHMIAGRLAVTAAFCRGMRNFRSEPDLDPVEDPVTVYHAMPAGLRTPERKLVRPGLFVDVSQVMDFKREMLALHRSQKDWLDASQGMGSYVDSMVEQCRTVGRLSGKFEFAEGWIRHLHLGMDPEDRDVLSEIMPGKTLVCPEFEKDCGA